jgi:hypothetical protein
MYFLHAYFLVVINLSVWNPPTARTQHAVRTAWRVERSVAVGFCKLSLIVVIIPLVRGISGKY